MCDCCTYLHNRGQYQDWVITSLAQPQEEAEHIGKIVVDGTRLLQHLKFDPRLLVKRGVE